MKTVHLLRALSVLLLGGFSATLFAGGHANCTVAGGTLLKWPATGPTVWEMCWLPPNQSSGVQGSGLEVRDVHYKGILVAKRFHSPILFAEYRNGSGGNCYRDWKDANARFAAAPAVRNQLGVPGSFVATTTCDVSKSATASHGTCPFNNLANNTFTNADCMASGVAIEDMTNAENPDASHVMLTTQYSASWYQYVSRIAFYANGDINPEFGYGNSNGTYNNVTHWHHNYWRLDFDIAGAEHDQISANGVLKPLEFTDLRSLTGGPDGGPTHWEVSDKVQNFGFRLTSGPSDYTPVNESGRNLHTADVIGTRFINNEYSDKADNNLNDCDMVATNLANGEDISDSDVVLYYTASVRDSTSNNWPTSANPVPQDSMVCKKVGPMITPVGDWPIFQDDFQQ